MSRLQDEFIAVVKSLSLKEATKEGWIKAIQQQYPLENSDYSKAYCHALFIYIAYPDIKHTELLQKFLFECFNKQFENKSDDEQLKAKNILDSQLRQLTQVAFHIQPEISNTRRSRMSDKF